MKVAWGDVCGTSLLFEGIQNVVQPSWFYTRTINSPVKITNEIIGENENYDDIKLGRAIQV